MWYTNRAVQMVWYYYVIQHDILTMCYTVCYNVAYQQHVVLTWYTTRVAQCGILTVGSEVHVDRLGQVGDVETLAGGRLEVKPAMNTGQNGSRLMPQEWSDLCTGNLGEPITNGLGK